MRVKPTTSYARRTEVDTNYTRRTEIDTSWVNYIIVKYYLIDSNGNNIVDNNGNRLFANTQESERDIQTNWA